MSHPFPPAGDDALYYDKTPTSFGRMKDGLATPPPPPLSPELRRQHRRIVALILALIVIVAGIFFGVLSLVSRPVTHPPHPKADATMTALATGFLATVTPALDATTTPTVGPGTPTSTPILIYVTAAPAATLRPLPTYTPRPGQPTYTPQPTWTPPPAPTATATSLPVKTLTDDENDLSQMSGHSANIVCCDTGYGSQFANDTSRVVDVAAAGGDWATYAAPNIVSVQVTLYFSPNYATVPCDFLVSADGVAWQGVQAGWTDNGGTWDQRIYTVSGIHANDFKIVWNSPYPYSPELGQVVINYQG